jgi:hypothetical protein
VEITDPAVDHAGVFNQDPGLAALAGVLEKFIYKQQPSAAAAAAKPSKQPSAAGIYKPAVEAPVRAQSLVGKGAVVLGKGAVVTGKAAGVTLRKGPFSFTFGH